MLVNVAKFSSFQVVVALCCDRDHYILEYTDYITNFTLFQHFISLDGPSDEYPDPCDAQTGELHRARRKIKYLSQQSKSDDYNYSSNSKTRFVSNKTFISL